VLVNQLEVLLDKVRRRGGASRSLFGAILIIGQPLILNVISLPVTAYIIARLGPTQWGSWSVALMLTTTATAFTNVGLRNLMIRTVARDRPNAGEIFAQHLGLRLFLVSFAGPALLLFCAAMGYPAIVLQCTAILFLGMLFTAVGNVASDLLQAVERLPLLASVNMVAGLLLTLASLLAIWLGVGPLGLAFAYVLGPLVTGCSSVVLIHRNMFPVRVKWSRTHFVELLSQSRHLGMPQVFGMLSHEAENLLVPKMVGLASYGHFAAGVLLPRRLLIVPDGLTTAFFPVLTRKFHQRGDDLVPSIKKFGLLMALACIPPALALVALADPISLVLFDENREECRLVMQFTAWAIPAIGFEMAMGYILTAGGKEREEARISILRAGLGIVISIVMISTLGLVGAAIAMPVKGLIGMGLRVPTLLGLLRAHDDTGLSATPAASAIE
jgi:O-antigen/teichoic acid export membrane protein